MKILGKNEIFIRGSFKHTPYLCSDKREDIMEVKKYLSPIEMEQIKAGRWIIILDGTRIWIPDDEDAESPPPESTIH